MRSYILPMSIVLFCAITALLLSILNDRPTPEVVTEPPQVEEITPEPDPTPEPTPTVDAEPDISPEPSPSYDISQDDIELIALVTMAEAEGEPEEGQRLVIDTILNRKDSEYFPDTVYDVIYQKNQFTCMWNGRIEQCEVRDEIVQLIEEELVSRTNSDVVFFRTGRYSSYGEPLFQVGNHYFSSYN